MGIREPAKVTAEAYEPVERGAMSGEDFRDFVFYESDQAVDGAQPGVLQGNGG
jgi:hypothetical protein